MVGSSFKQRNLAAFLVGEREDLFEARVSVAQLVASTLFSFDPLFARGLLAGEGGVLKVSVVREGAHPDFVGFFVVSVTGAAARAVDRTGRGWGRMDAGSAMDEAVRA